jgi:alkylation response protein AidB-like acyl-CoA dehydrogenase
MAAEDVQVHLAETADGAAVTMISANASAHQRWPIKEAGGIQGGDPLRLGYAAELVGLMDEARRRTVVYLTVRKQFGSPIGSFQAIQHRAASLYVELLACRSLVYEAGRAYRRARQSAAALMAKARVSHASRSVLHECVQFHGAMGYVEEHDIGLYFRRGTALGAAGGTTFECLALLAAATGNHR